MLNLNSIPNLRLWLNGDNKFVDLSSDNNIVVGAGVTVDINAVNGRPAFNLHSDRFISIKDSVGNDFSKSNNYTIISVFSVDELETGITNLCTASTGNDPIFSYYNVGLDHSDGSLTVAWGDSVADYESYTKAYMFKDDRFFLFITTVASDPFVGNNNYYNSTEFEMDYNGTSNSVNTGGLTYPFRLGGFIDNDIRIAEFALYDRVLNENEIENITEDMNSKYDLQIPGFSTYSAVEGLPYSYALSGENLLGEEGQINIKGISFPYPLDTISVENYSGNPDINFRIIREKTGQTLSVVNFADFGKTLDMAHVGPNEKLRITDTNGFGKVVNSFEFKFGYADRSWSSDNDEFSSDSSLSAVSESSISSSSSSTYILSTSSSQSSSSSSSSQSSDSSSSTVNLSTSSDSSSESSSSSPSSSLSSQSSSSSSSSSSSDSSLSSPSSSLSSDSSSSTVNRSTSSDSSSDSSLSSDSSSSTVNQSTSSDSSSDSSQSSNFGAFTGAIYMDAVSGDDNNAGWTIGDPIQTIARLNDRFLLVNNIMDIDVYFASGKYSTSVAVVLPTPHNYIVNFIGSSPSGTVDTGDVGIDSTTTANNIYGTKLNVWLEHTSIGGTFVLDPLLQTYNGTFLCQNILFSSSDLGDVNLRSNGLGSMDSTIINTAVVGFRTSIRYGTKTSVATDVIIANGGDGATSLGADSITFTRVNVVHMAGEGFYNMGGVGDNIFSAVDCSADDCTIGWRFFHVNADYDRIFDGLDASNCLTGIEIRSPSSNMYTITNSIYNNCDTGVKVRGGSGGSPIVFNNCDFINSISRHIQTISYDTGVCTFNSNCTFTGSPSLHVYGFAGSGVQGVGELNLTAINTDAWDITMVAGSQCNVSNAPTTGTFVPLYNTVDGNNSRIY